MAKICVLLAAYRDPELLDTINSCLSQASNPTRISFAICWQGSVEVEWQVEALQTIPNCRVAYYDHSQCQGVGWARLITQSLVHDEEYILQIDSHSRLAKDWDSRMIAMLNGLPERSLLFAIASLLIPMSLTALNYTGLYPMLFTLKATGLTNLLQWAGDYAQCIKIKSV